jgi:hypothetical protein
MQGTGPQDGEPTAHLEGGMAKCNDPPKWTGENRQERAPYTGMPGGVTKQSGNAQEGSACRDLVRQLGSDTPLASALSQN